MGLSPSAKRGIFSLLLLFVVAAAAVPRLAILENRPMHCDEAVHGVKFGLLLEHADYLYDPYEYHGPSLNFLTLPVAYLASAQNVVEITEVHLRLVPAIFGILLVGLVWPLRHELGLPAALCAAVLTAVSPAMVFYSRYYIQEMLLVCFTFAAMAALWGYAREVTCSGTRHYSRLRQGLWLVLLGLCIGMMHASKETCVIALFAITVAAALTIGSLRRIGPRPATISVLVVLLVAANVSILLFSSFMANPRGVLDSVTTYFHYLGRASGEGSVGRHVYPWDYYLRVLFWWQRGEGPVWS